MLIPAWHIGVLAALYAVEYVWRAWSMRERRFIYIGKAGARFILSAVFLWFAFMDIEAESRAVWVRWSLFIWLVTDLIFVALEHAMRLIDKYKETFLEWVKHYAKHPR